MPDPAPPVLAARRVRVEGRVQGVGFRHACVIEARALGLTGWVRNRHDGSVEVMLQGPPGDVERILAWLHRGPAAARVTRVVALDAAPESWPGFEPLATV
jgi:acylphosphatase